MLRPFRGYVMLDLPLTRVRPGKKLIAIDLEPSRLSLRRIEVDVEEVSTAVS
jgi:hypothetical protein